MPELPEVEQAAAVARAAAVGRHIESVALLHPALQRRTSEQALASLAGAIIERVVRRGKHQLMQLADGRAIHVHFRMSGDWTVAASDASVPRHARATISLSDGGRLVLVDPRALATFTVHEAGGSPLPELGPEPSDPALTTESLRTAFRARRGPIKPVLLDQRIIAGVGNIYASEALWLARISPRAKASSLSLRRVKRLLDGIRRVLGPAGRPPGRYRAVGGDRSWSVYDREGLRCRRCGHRISRIVQAGRSTYFCGRCQRS